ncbi:hypothetical protein [Flavobacterium sp. LM4]|uniref:hypothetical protein n=1 Tax=Flavobacterium sp. LM4 TaxID=1938609 RepID=UPI0009941C01|nr:hypothetical protein [Flavobacterium sp. LM4]OOV19567.1 hypothetical protein BXU10_07930 [Flavobacterium sp. LM4]
MKKILFLILFLTGITPVLKNNAINLVCYSSYGQEDSLGLEEVVICNEPDQITVDDYGSYTMTETCVWSNKDGIDTNDCEWNCSSVRSENEPPDDNDDKPDCTGEIGGSAYLASCGCIGGSTGIESCDSDPGNPDPGGPGNPCGNEVMCDSGYQLNYTTCNCVCTRTCPTGYRLENCECVKINTPPPPDPDLDPCNSAATAAGTVASNIMKNNNVKSAFDNLPAFTYATNPEQNEFIFNIKKNRRKYHDNSN